MSHLLGVIGDPIEHSLSPLMHNRWYSDLHLSHYYKAFHLKPEQLEAGVKAIKTLQLRGVNVTIPHKQSVISYLDERDEEARDIGAVNTIVNVNGSLKGYNTDGRGLVRAILEKWPQALQDAHVLIIGAGGASLGVALTLAKSGVKQVDIANRTIEKAKFISQKCSTWTHSNSLTLQEAESRLGAYTMVIHSTPIGMAPEWVDQSPIPLATLKEGTICIDLIYNPLKTKWLKEAEEKGALIMNGLPMLVHQGALSFEHWFGIKPDTQGMITYLTNYLGGKLC